MALNSKPKTGDEPKEGGVKMVALQTIHRNYQSGEPQVNRFGLLQRGAIKSVVNIPGDEKTGIFETNEEEAAELERSGAAERYVEEKHGKHAKKPEPVHRIDVAENTAPRGPHSGASSTPSPEKVAAKSGGIETGEHSEVSKDDDAGKTG